MSYPREKAMNPNIERELAKERRTRLIDPNDPEVKDLWNGIKATIETIAQPGVNTDQITEFLLVYSLLFAYQDQLSGLPNRKGVMIELEAATAVAKRFNLAMSVLFMDGKDFKAINDTMGNMTGDDVIAAIGEGARRALDIKLHLTGEEESADEEFKMEVGRHAGDQFIAILLGTNLDGAKIVAQKINQAFAQAVDERVPTFRQTFHRPFEVTIGMAQFDPNIDGDGLSVLKRADQNLTLQRQARGESRRS